MDMVEVEIERDGAAGSRRSPMGASERARVLADYRASGLTQKAYAERAGLKLGTLVGWLQRERRERTEA